MKEWIAKDDKPRRWLFKLEFFALMAGQLLGLAALLSWVLG